MADVLLTHSYFLRFDKKQWKTMRPYAPLGTLYAASVLRNAGMDVALFDSMLAESERDLAESIQRHRPKIVAIYDDSFNYLTKMCLARMRLAAFRMIEIARDMGCIVIVSSSDAADHVAEYLSRGTAFVVKGEGEFTLLELCTALLGQDTRDTVSIQGVCHLSDGKVIQTPPRGVVKELDSIPFPAWDLVDVNAYKACWARHGYFSMNVVTTRGCPFGCNWCAKPIYGRVYNSRSPRNVVDEITFLKEWYNPDHIWFCDDIFGLRPGWIEEFGAEMARARINVRYKCLSRPDLLLKEDSFKSLSTSGCETVWIGAESGEQQILDAMEKGTTIGQIRLATRKLKREGIRVGYFLQFGYPGESYEMIKKTIGLVREEMPDEIGVSVSYPLPGTKFFQSVHNRIGQKTNWFDSDDLALLFPGEFRPAFYRMLHRVIHRLHRIRQIIGRKERFTVRTVLACGFNIITLPACFLGMQITRKRNHSRISRGTFNERFT